MIVATPERGFLRNKGGEPRPQIRGERRRVPYPILQVDSQGCLIKSRGNVSVKVKQS